jgi:hypothetical protein
MEMNCDTPDKLTGYRKAITENLKKFDKLYMQHPKIAHPTISGIHTKTLKPLTDVIESNINLYYFEQL